MKESKPAYNVQTLAIAEAAHVTYVLELYEWNLTKTAKALDINRRTLGRIIERNKLEPALAITAAGEAALEEHEADLAATTAIVQCPNCSSELDVDVTKGPNYSCTECGKAFMIANHQPESVTP